jgi:hypothetical protein
MIHDFPHQFKWHLHVFCLANTANRKPYVQMPLLMQQLDVGLISTQIGWRLSPTLPQPNMVEEPCRRPEGMPPL